MRAEAGRCDCAGPVPSSWSHPATTPAEVLDLPDSARPYYPHFAPPGGAARSRQAPRVATPSKVGRPSSASPPAPSSGKRKQAKAGGQPALPGRPAKRAKAGPGGEGSGARKRGVRDDEGLEGGSRPPARNRSRQERHHQGEPAGSSSLCSGPADTAGVAGMLLRLQQGGAQPPRGGQQQAGLLAGTLQPTPSQGQAGGGRGAAILTQQGGSQAGPAGAGGLQEAFEAAQPTQRQRGRAARQRADFSGVPDPAGAPGAGALKSIEVFNVMASRGRECPRQTGAKQLSARSHEWGWPACKLLPLLRQTLLQAALNCTF